MRSDQASRRCCVLVPLYRPSLTKVEALSLVATHQRAAGQGTLAILHPPEMTPFIRQLQEWFAGYNHKEGPTYRSVEFPSRFFKSVSAYSNLLMSEDFYERLSGHEWLFIIQSDALLLSDQWSSWLDCPHSYIGAPWFVGLDQPRQPLRPLGGGNGGFSLRRIADCREVLRYRGWLYHHWRRLELGTLPDQRWRAEGRAARRLLSFAGRFEKINIYEDLFWSFMAPHLSPTFSVAPFRLASGFAFETEPRALFQQTQIMPVGCHAHERHDPVFWSHLWRSHPNLLGSLTESANQLMANLHRI